VNQPSERLRKNEGKKRVVKETTQKPSET